METLRWARMWSGVHASGGTFHGYVLEKLDGKEADYDCPRLCLAMQEQINRCLSYDIVFDGTLFTGPLRLEDRSGRVALEVQDDINRAFSIFDEIAANYVIAD